MKKITKIRKCKKVIHIKKYIVISGLLISGIYLMKKPNNIFNKHINLSVCS